MKPKKLVEVNIEKETINEKLKLEAEGLVNLALGIYHCEEYPVDCLDLGLYPHIPYRCPICNKLISSHDNLKYDVIISRDYRD